MSGSFADNGPANTRLTTRTIRRCIARQDGQKNFLVAILGSKESAGLSTDEIHSNMLLLL